MTALFAQMALRTLGHARMEFACNVAMILGVLVPLLAVLGAKNGINDGLYTRLTERAGLLEIETSGNDLITAEQFETIKKLDGVAFATLKVRSGTDFLVAQNANGGDFINVRLRITGSGDPLSAAHPQPDLESTVISADLADRLELANGDRFDASTDGDGRLRHAYVQMRVSGVLAPDQLDGDVMLVSLAFMDLLEAYSEGYAVPALGVDDGFDLADRVPSFEGVQVTANSLHDVGPIAQALTALLNRTLRSDERLIAETLATQAYLNRAFQLVAMVGCVGLAAALAATQVNAILRQRRGLATLMLLGSTRQNVAIFPIVSACVTILTGIVLSLLGYGILGQISGALGGENPVTLRLRPQDVFSLILFGGLVATLSSAVGIRKLMSVDPAIILRESI